jgi:hypothetical protein
MIGEEKVPKKIKFIKVKNPKVVRDELLAAAAAE